jgi:hypothetical protein
VWDFKNGNTGDAVVGVAVNNVISQPSKRGRFFV